MEEEVDDQIIGVNPTKARLGAPLSRSFMTTRQQGFSLKLTRLEEVSVIPHTDSER